MHTISVTSEWLMAIIAFFFFLTFHGEFVAVSVEVSVKARVRSSRIVNPTEEITPLLL